jgi:replicative DNA helicase
MLLDYEYVRIVEQNRIAPGDLNGYITEYEQITGRRPALVIIDYLQYFARSFRGNSAYDRSTDAVMELKAVAKEELVPIIAPSQVNRTAEAGKPLTLSHARDAGTVEETGDFVLSLYRPELVTEKVDPNTPATAPTGNFNAQLLKSRHGGVGRVFNLRFSPMSLVIVDQLDRKNAMRVSQEVSLANQGVHYDDYRQRLEAQSAQSPIPGVTP